jgi:hypothetical protein
MSIQGHFLNLCPPSPILDPGPNSGKKSAKSVSWLERFVTRRSLDASFVTSAREYADHNLPPVSPLFVRAVVRRNEVLEIRFRLYRADGYAEIDL